MKQFTKLIVIGTVFLVGYAILRLILLADVKPITFEIFAAIIGFTITALTTWALLGKQTEAELRKEEQIRFLHLKTSIYVELVKQLEDIVRKEDIRHEDVIELRLLNQQMIFIASEEVLQAFNKFVIYFSRFAHQDGMSSKDIDDLLDEMTKLSITIRKDLLNYEVRKDIEDLDLERLTLHTNELLDFEDQKH